MKIVGKMSNMFYGASHLIFKKAEALRENMTPSEALLWEYLRINDWKVKFRRQHPIAIYIADFYCHALKLVIEVDGGYHKDPEVKINDARRQSDIEKLGVHVLRFANEEVINDIESVKARIKSTIDTMEVDNNNIKEAVTPLGDGGKKRLFVIKIGGNVIDDEIKLSSFLKDFASIQSPCILVHGGGKIATRIGEQLGIESKYVDGRRITDDDTIDLVTMVYAGLVNKKMVAQLQSLGCNAIGLTGVDANIIPAQKRPVKTIDYGWVGDINTSNISSDLLKGLLDLGLQPVFAPLTHDGSGHMLNTNADTIASAIAVALSSFFDVRLMYCFEKKGVLGNVDDDDSVIAEINRNNYDELKADGKLFAGILPKIDNAFAAIDAGVNEVLIGHADDVLQNTTGQTSGTLIK